MGKKTRPHSLYSPPSSCHSPLISGLREKYEQELESLTLTTQPLKTLKLFILALFEYMKKTTTYLLAKGGWLFLISTLILAAVLLLLGIDGPQEKHIEEFRHYFWFALWWVALGVASSIGLGSGLHTFVLYLGPHIAFFTIKAIKCGRIDLKSAPYDTIQMKRAPSWLDKECSEFGPPIFASSHGLSVPLSSILPQVQLEAVLWGIGTALGELPPYFISKAASLSGGKLEDIVELDSSNEEGEGYITSRLNKLKRWFLSHAQHMNFFTILVLASVPNPLFDFAGIICGQFGISFWTFFLATLIGKAIIKAHIQTIFIISVCNNQLLDWIENEVIWLLSQVPGFAAVLPNIVAKLNAMRDKYLAAPAPSLPHIKVKKWDLSFASVWNAVVWIMLLNFFIQIINATSLRYLKKQQEKELATLINKSSAPTDTS